MSEVKNGKYEDSEGEVQVCWYKNDCLHREDGPAIEYFDDSKAWYLNGQRHREDGPAVEHPDGTKQWFFNGKSHREDGPAIEFPSGYKRWFIHGMELTEEQFNHFLGKKALNGKLHSTLAPKPIIKRGKI